MPNKICQVFFCYFLTEFTAELIDVIACRSLDRNNSKELLSRGVPIKETAEFVGWDDEFYFMRIFKKISGITPGRFHY